MTYQATACITLTTLVSMVLHQGGIKPPFDNMCLQISPGAILVGITFSLRPDKVMFWHGKSLSVLINIFCSMQFTRDLAIYIGYQAE